MAYPSASCLGKLTAPLAPTRTREALVPDDRGLSPVIARVGDLGPTNAICFAGAWQVAFLGEIEPRAARPGRPARRVQTMFAEPRRCITRVRWLLHVNYRHRRSFAAAFEAMSRRRTLFPRFRLMS
jgi:hypothetical protein